MFLGFSPRTRCPIDFICLSIVLHRFLFFFPPCKFLLSTYKPVYSVILLQIYPPLRLFFLLFPITYSPFFFYNFSRSLDVSSAVVSRIFPFVIASLRGLSLSLSLSLFLSVCYTINAPALFHMSANLLITLLSSLFDGCSTSGLLTV